jgi:hypothetical protein
MRAILYLAICTDHGLRSQQIYSYPGSQAKLKTIQPASMIPRTTACHGDIQDGQVADGTGRAVVWGWLPSVGLFALEIRDHIPKLVS